MTIPTSQDTFGAKYPRHPIKGIGGEVRGMHKRQESLTIASAHTVTSYKTNHAPEIRDQVIKGCRQMWDPNMAAISLRFLF